MVIGSHFFPLKVQGQPHRGEGMNSTLLLANRPSGIILKLAVIALSHFRVGTDPWIKEI